MWKKPAFQTHLSVFNKVGIDGAASVAARSPLQVVHVRFVRLRRADDDGRLWRRPLVAPVGRGVGGVAGAVVVGQEVVVSLVALHGVERQRRIQSFAGGGICQKNTI